MSFLAATSEAMALKCSTWTGRAFRIGAEMVELERTVPELYAYQLVGVEMALVEPLLLG